MNNSDIIQMLTEKRGDIKNQISDRVDELLRDIERAKQTETDPVLRIATLITRCHDFEKLLGEYESYDKMLEKAELMIYHEES